VRGERRGEVRLKKINQFSKKRVIKKKREAKRERDRERKEHLGLVFSEK
jgi:hypothetical protein